jgi:hypothetical protein
MQNIFQLVFIVNFLKGSVDKFLYRICREKRFMQGFEQGFEQGFVQGFEQGFEQEYILHTRIYFQLFRFFIGDFLKGSVDKYLYRICREKNLINGLYKGLYKVLYKNIFCIQNIFSTFQIFYSMVFIVNFLKGYVEKRVYARL